MQFYTCEQFCVYKCWRRTNLHAWLITHCTHTSEECWYFDQTGQQGMLGWFWVWKGVLRNCLGWVLETDGSLPHFAYQGLGLLPLLPFLHPLSSFTFRIQPGSISSASVSWTVPYPRNGRTETKLLEDLVFQFFLIPFHGLDSIPFRHVGHLLNGLPFYSEHHEEKQGSSFGRQ
jgi:hypothetical protein